MITCKFEDGGDGELRHSVVHALAIKNGKILLVKRSEKVIDSGRWAFPGGFIDRNETAQQAALRELKEETGWEGKVLLFFRLNSNPDRPRDAGRQNIPLEFLVEPTQKTGEPDSEQSEVKWFDIDEVDLETMAFDHNVSMSLIQRYVKGEVKPPIVDI